MAKQSFVTGQVLTAQQVNDLQTNDFNQTVSAKTASYTLVAADKGTRITMSSTSATTITVNTGLFAAGDTLFIQNLNTGVATITAGTATVNTSASLALAQWEGGTLYFTSASAAIFIKGAGAAASSGAVVQVKNGSTSTQASSSSVTFADTGLSVSITPTSASNKILVFVCQNGLSKSSNDVGNALDINLYRGATSIAIVVQAASFTNSALLLNGETAAQTFLDAPATTSAITYKTMFRNNGGNAASIKVQQDGALSTITVMEVTP